MLTIRDEQMRALSAAREVEFETRLVQRSPLQFPGECAALGSGGVREMVRYALRKALSHGFATERDLVRYVDLAFTFGRDFDVDPSLPWAANILAAPQQEGGASRMDRLFLVAMANEAQM